MRWLVWFEQGFSGTVNAIIENLPPQRQTMLFSATQTRSVKDLARLSLRDPTYIAIHAEAVAPTPLKLQQVWAPFDPRYQMPFDDQM